MPFIYSRAESKERMDEWNTLVDSYINSTKDARSRFEIELFAKIGMDGGPLYKRCEAQSCTNVEVRDVTPGQMKRCSACKLVSAVSPGTGKNTHCSTNIRSFIATLPARKRIGQYTKLTAKRRRTTHKRYLHRLLWRGFRRSRPSSKRDATTTRDCGIYGTSRLLATS